MVMSKAERKAFNKARKEKLAAMQPPVIKRPADSSNGSDEPKPKKQKKQKPKQATQPKQPTATVWVPETQNGFGKGKGKGKSKGGKGGKGAKGKGKGEGKGGFGGKGGKSGGKGDGGGGGYAGKHPARPGDWTCHKCYANVFGSLSDCYKCHIPRLGDPSASGVAEMLVRPVPYTSTVRSIDEHFSASRPVSYRLGWDKAGSYCKGYVFLTFANDEAAEACRREWDGVKMAGKTLVVTPADGVEDELVSMSGDEVKALKKGGGGEAGGWSGPDVAGWNTPGDAAVEEKEEQAIDGSEYDSFMDSFNDDGSLTTEAELPTNYEALTYDPEDYTKQRTELLTRQIATHAQAKQLAQAVAAFELLKSEGLTPDHYRSDATRTQFSLFLLAPQL